MKSPSKFFTRPEYLKDNDKAVSILRHLWPNYSNIRIKPYPDHILANRMREVADMTGVGYWHPYNRASWYFETKEAGILFKLTFG